MKKIIALGLSALITCAVMASDPFSSWITSKEGTYFCQTINMGARKARIIFENGEKMSIPVGRINSFSLSGIIFEKLPLYKSGKQTNRHVFMELVKISDGFSLYRYGHCKNKSNRSDETVHNYYLYKGDKLYLALNNIAFPDDRKYDQIKPAYK